MSFQILIIIFTGFDTMMAPSGMIALSGMIAPSGMIALSGMIASSGMIALSGMIAPSGMIALSGMIMIAPSGNDLMRCKIDLMRCKIDLMKQNNFDLMCCKIDLIKQNNFDLMHCKINLIQQNNHDTKTFDSMHYPNIIQNPNLNRNISIKYHHAHKHYTTTKGLIQSPNPCITYDPSFHLDLLFNNRKCSLPFMMELYIRVFFNFHKILSTFFMQE
jgi:hypothetical protein